MKLTGESTFLEAAGHPRALRRIPVRAATLLRTKKIGLDALKYTLKPRQKDTHDPFEKGAKLLNPGPGTYSSIGIDKEGKYSVSNLPNSKAQVWSPAKSKRFKEELHSHLKNPPPGTYNPSD